jgi:hypothetical protein
MKSWRAWLAFLAGTLCVVALGYQFAAPMQIAVGTRSADPFVEGFSFREQAPFGSFRWSQARARVLFRGIGNQAGTLSIVAGAPESQVILGVNGQELASFLVSGGPKEYIFPIERARLGIGGDLVVTLKSDTFTAPPDTRELGLQVVSATFVPGSGRVLPAPLTVLATLGLAILVMVIARAWSGSALLAWGSSSVVVLAVGWGLARSRLEAAWLVGVVFWFTLAVFLGGWGAIWLLRRFYPVENRTLRMLGLVVLAAFAVRLPLALTPGFVTDVQDYVVWSYKLAHYGLGSAYAVIGGLWVADYPPVLLYAFQGLGLVYQKLFAPDFLYPVTAGDPALRALTTNAALLADPIHRTLLRLPAILADLVAGGVIFVVVRRSLSTGKSLLIAASYWFNPAVIYNSAFYGQTDAVHSLLVLLAFALVETTRGGWGFFALAVAGLTKPQSLVFGPLLLLRTFQRQRWRGLSLAAIGGALGIAVAAAPVIAVGALPGLLAHLSETVGHHPLVSANAHNLWWFLMHGNTWVEDTLVAFGGLSYRVAGLLLLAMAYALALGSALRRPDRDAWPLAAYVGFAFYMLPTEIHENYGFAVLALLAVAVAKDRRFVWPYLVLTVTMLANHALHDPAFYALLNLPSPEVQLGAARWINAAVNVLVFAGWTAGEVVALVRTSPGRPQPADLGEAQPPERDAPRPASAVR